MGLNTTVTSTLDWVNYDTRVSLTTLADDGIVRPTCTLSSGTGLGQANEHWYASGHISPTAIMPIDLRELNYSSYRNQFFKLLSHIKLFHLVNLNSSGSIVIQSSGTSLVSGVQFLAGKCEAGPGGTLQWYAADGVIITSGTRFIYLRNPNTFTVGYKVALVGLREGSIAIDVPPISTSCGYSNGFSPGFC
jgi:hypothetical protein